MVAYPAIYLLFIYVVSSSWGTENKVITAIVCNYCCPLHDDKNKKKPYLFELILNSAKQ